MTLLSDRAADITRLPAEQPPVMSFAQERLWFMEQLRPDTDAYVLWDTARLRGPLRTDVLAAALRDVVARHDTLRMYFPATADGRPEVRIAPAVDVPLRVVPPGTAGGPDVLEWARSQIAQQMRPFDLTTAPLLRALVVELGPDDHVLHVAMHHIISDGWSRSVLMRDWAAGYTARLGLAPPPEPLPIQYEDYAAWQRDRLAEAGTDLDYWRQTLDGVPPLDLPTDRPRPTEVTTGGSAWRFRFPGELTEALHRLGRHHRASVFMVLLTGLHALLHRITGQRDFAVGAPVAGRVRPELENVIGLFVNMLALRATIHEAMTFTELLKQTRGRVVGALAHQELPFERLVQELRIERDTGRSPLFQVMFAMHNREGSPARWPDPLVSEPFVTAVSSSRQDISLYVGQDREGMRATLAYRDDLFDEPAMARFGQMLCRLLEAAVVTVSLRVPRLARFYAEVPDALPDDVVGLQAWQSRKASPVAGFSASRQQADRAARG